MQAALLRVNWGQVLPPHQYRPLPPNLQGSIKYWVWKVGRIRLNSFRPLPSIKYRLVTDNPAREDECRSTRFRGVEKRGKPRGRRERDRVCPHAGLIFNNNTWTGSSTVSNHALRAYARIFHFSVFRVCPHAGLRVLVTPTPPIWLIAGFGVRNIYRYFKYILWIWYCIFET